MFISSFQTVCYSRFLAGFEKVFNERHFQRDFDRWKRLRDNRQRIQWGIEDCVGWRNIWRLYVVIQIPTCKHLSIRTSAKIESLRRIWKNDVFLTFGPLRSDRPRNKDPDMLYLYFEIRGMRNQWLTYQNTTFWGLIFGCVEADFGKYIRIFAAFF